MTPQKKTVVRKGKKHTGTVLLICYMCVNNLRPGLSWVVANELHIGNGFYLGKQERLSTSIICLYLYVVVLHLEYCSSVLSRQIWKGVLPAH